MSAENSRLTRAIQRIAREDPLRSESLDGAAARGDQPGGAGVSESTAERDRLCCDGSISGSANPGIIARDTGDGGQGGLDPSDPANLESGPGELTGVVDCATGQPACLDGVGFIPPAGWDDSSDPPIKEGYEEGKIWACVDNTRVLCTTLSWTYPGDGYCSFAIGYRLSHITVGFAESRCPTQMGEIGDPETEDSWPADGCVNLAIIGGSIVGSKYDPENDGSYSAPRDEIELCDPENGTSILIRPSSDGGWKSIQSLAGEPDGAVDYGYLYAPDGKRIRQISPSEFRDDMV